MARAPIKTSERLHRSHRRAKAGHEVEREMEQGRRVPPVDRSSVIVASSVLLGNRIDADLAETEA